MADCIFCRIVAGTIPSNKVYEDEIYLAFKDIHPKAPVHYLVIPKAHSERLDALARDGGAVALGELMLAAVRTAEATNLGDYRLAVNVGSGAGQLVFHTHLHLLSGWRHGAGEVG
ncbi:MAG: histidine triad nucleotide-binding protein [Truepera sp.]|nr:histidine triad nucleotide-binding protein [Truepera sp.]